MIGAQVPDTYLVTAITLGFGVVVSMVAWSLRLLLKISETVARHDERIRDLEDARRIPPHW